MNVGASVAACRAVAELLPGKQLRQLHLYNNMTGDEGAEHVAAVLARAPHLEDFRLASSRVGPDGGAALARGLAAGAVPKRCCNRHTSFGCWRQRR